MDGRARLHRLTRLVTAAALAVASLGLLAPPAEAEAGPKVSVLTRNLYLGGDLTPSINAPTLPAFLAANAGLLSHVDLVDFPARAKLIAQEIRDHEPDLVGLQEVALWRTGPIGNPAPATSVRYDYLALLMGELAAAGHPYDVAVVQDEADLEAPAGAPHNLDVRLTMRDVILVRHGDRVKVTDRSSGNFTHNLVLPLAATGGSATSTRGWTAVDAVLGTRSFRFVNTHLEAFHAGIRVQQAQELLQGPLAAPGRVILVGDLNTGPELPVPDNRLAYFTLVAGGMVDTWPILHPGEPGYTAGLGDDLVEPADDVEHRIDMVMFRGAVVPVNSEVFGTERQTADGRWASDHLGHVAELALP
ncbi:Metal-dependent hydrolase, endonuclease/exonuclease/phosphatase family [Micromonospora rhizosphaerae]|uniref:Metal-dependent hydrolase, endonuclease/exonuclease/phosphatase family n=1 Tax=Micromonospora rhizosphaerae TaxID=568872 RepID=A0A1C6SMZ8_9ACTN|nr:endonuclease/exonuclease/phosphatase family protein [Micromonospora rhizosphaerae]SCL30783.1 Metal-dependent hydrolase, endonuclease/exonuclease/phosphatase family [Micromonospora rhizosphaerae]